MKYKIINFFVFFIFASCSQNFPMEENNKMNYSADAYTQNYFTGFQQVHHQPLQIPQLRNQVNYKLLEQRKMQFERFRNNFGESFQQLPPAEQDEILKQFEDINTALGIGPELETQQPNVPAIETIIFDNLINHYFPYPDSCYNPHPNEEARAAVVSYLIKTGKISKESEDSPEPNQNHNSCSISWPDKLAMFK